MSCYVLLCYIIWYYIILIYIILYYIILYYIILYYIIFSETPAAKNLTHNNTGLTFSTSKSKLF